MSVTRDTKFFQTSPLPFQIEIQHTIISFQVVLWYNVRPRLKPRMIKERFRRYSLSFKMEIEMLLLPGNIGNNGTFTQQIRM